jgi:hypothetical protein
MGRARAADRDQIAAYPSLVLHRYQVFEYIAPLAEVFKMIVAYRQDTILQESVNPL